MLSRVAESLYWLARYVERAEDMTRLLAVNFNALLDTQPAEAAQGWAPLVAMTGDEALFAEVYGPATAEAVIEFLLFNNLNPNSVSACITRARENARTVREQISSEMWETLNRLYFLVRNVDRTAVRANPLEFFRDVRDGAHAFQGVTLATMTHSEAYEFIRIGHHLERADKTVRILDAKYLYLNRLPPGSAETSLQLIALLRSCSAFEPFRTAGLTLAVDRVAEYLLVDREFPRAVLFCVSRSMQSLAVLGGDPAPGSDHPRRSLGRLAADLDYLDLHSVLGPAMDPFLNQLLQRLNHISDDVARTFFNTRVIAPDERPRQQQQQQQ